MSNVANTLVRKSREALESELESAEQERDALKLKLDVATKAHNQVVELCEAYQNACIEGCEPESIQADSDRRINLICKTSCEALSQLNSGAEKGTK